MNRVKKAILAATALGSTVMMAGCSFLPSVTVEDLPLPAPGGIRNPITLSASFEDALNLPQRAKVRLRGSDVGEVTDISVAPPSPDCDPADPKIELCTYRADVKMNIDSAARIPVGTGAELRQATPLGDVFVALVPPEDDTQGVLTNGQTLTGPTGAAATVEDLLISMTAVVDSGSINSVTRIFTELSEALSYRSDEFAGAITEFTTALTRFNDNSKLVDDAIAQTAEMTQLFADGKDQITAAVNKLGPAIDSVNGQMDLILSTLSKSNQVTGATVDFLDSDEENLIEMLGHLNDLAIALNTTAPKLGPLSDTLATLVPRWSRSMSSSAAAVSAKIFWLSPGAGFDSASRLPELDDLDMGMEALEQTINNMIARLTGTGGAS